MTSLIRGLCTLAPLAALIGCGGGESAVPAPDAPVAITIQPDWYPQPEQGGFFMAMADGRYAEAGLAVRMLDAAPNLPFLQKVAKGDATVGITRLDLLAQAVERGLPIVVIGKYSEHAPSGIMFPADSDIEDFADLDGKRVMAAVYAPYIDFIQGRYGIEMKLIPHNWGTAQFLAGEIDAQQCYVTSEPYYVERAGMPVRTLFVADAGYDPPHVIYTSREALDANREALQRFFQASMDGWNHYLKGDPAPAHALIAAGNPKMDEDFMTWSHGVLRDEGLIWGRRPELRPNWGQLSEQEALDAIAALKSVGELQEMAADDLSWVDFEFQWSEPDGPVGE